MNNFKLLLVCSLVFVFALSGCNDLKRAAKSSRQMYVEYIEPSPEVDLDVADLGDEEERRLALLFKPVDEHLDKLSRFLDGMDEYPQEKWMESLFSRFSWLGGVMVVDTSGDIQFQHPVDYSRADSAKKVLELGMAKRPAEDEDYEPDPNLEVQPWGDHQMRAMTGQGPMGSEVYLGMPIFESNGWRGLTIVHFDPRNLLEFCPEPNEIIVFSPEKAVWTSKNESAAAAMIDEPWEEILKDQVSGVWSGGGQSFYWVARYLGDYYLLFAAEIK